MRPLALLLAGVVLAAHAEPAPEYQPLGYLAGHCWKGSFPGGKVTDEHCFSWMYGGKFLRDRHTVRGGPKGDAFGESIYFWNPAEKRLEYLYVESDGGFSRGAVATAPDALVFPPTSYVDKGHLETYRSRWTRSGADAYDVVTEFQSGDTWTEGFKVHMVLSGEAPP